MTTDGVGNTGTISTPDLSESLKPKRRSIRDAAQAKNIFTTLEEASRLRNIKNARIAAKYASEKPYSTSSLEEEGLSWKSNFSTSPLVMLIDKVAPRFSQAVEGVKYLTNSSLPDDAEGADVKTEAFRREVTSTVRARPEWKDFISALAMENSLFGFAAVAFLDEFTSTPRFFRQDNLFLPTGTKQCVSGAQVVCLRETFLIHELFGMIDDKEAAIARGWNVESVVKVLNNAVPESRRSHDRNWERVYEDLRRESTVGTSFEAGAVSVTIIHLLAVEINGKVSHYVFDSIGFSELLTSEDRYERMSDAVSFFTFQWGNGTVHGSRGIGRQIYAMASILDRSRNEVVDRMNLAGKVIVQGDSKQLRKFKMQLVGNSILIGSEFTVSEVKIESAVEPFLSLDNFMQSLLDQMSGSVSPKAIEGERVTKAAVDLLASREEEGRDIVITRFLQQFSQFISTLQKRMCNSEVTDDDCKAMQKRLLEIMTRKELTKISEQPATETVKDYSGSDRQQLVLIAQEAMGNPLINQKELMRRQLTARVSDEFAEAILLPDEDPTVEAEQTRLQLMELLIVAGQGAEVPISPRDNHVVHLGVLMPVLEQVAQKAVEDPSAVPILQAILKHSEAHVAAAEAGGQKGAVAEFKSTISKLSKAMPELVKNAEAASQATAAGAPPEAAPVDNVAPMQ